MVERDDIRTMDCGVPADLREAELLVYGECDCGWRCACPEGARWPKCPTCDLLVMPPRKEGRLGYVAVMMYEQAAVKTLAAARTNGGLLTLPAITVPNADPLGHWTNQQRRRHWTRDQLRTRLAVERV